MCMPQKEYISGAGKDVGESDRDSAVEAQKKKLKERYFGKAKKQKNAQIVGRIDKKGRHTKIAIERHAAVQ